MKIKIEKLNLKFVKATLNPLEPASGNLLTENSLDKGLMQALAKAKKGRIFQSWCRYCSILLPLFAHVIQICLNPYYDM